MGPEHVAFALRTAAVVVLAAVTGCGQAKPMPAVPAAVTSYAVDAGTATSQPLGDAAGSTSPEDAAAVLESSVAQPSETVDAATADGASATATTGSCPDGMLLVDTDYCPHIERTCVDEEYSPQNKITICHKFAKHQRCLVPEEHRRFCIDKYEYPNREGAHPPWMVSWYDAQATCGSEGKRLCWESEWIAACEGPEKTPFPYGYSRDNTKCNVDNTWIDPHLGEVYSKDPERALRELSRLDQSAPSGARSECVSGYGVHDMTGNFDEWVTAERLRKDNSEWAGLKGGAWGHVRNACRPVTTSHPPDFTYYFISFRCCADGPGGETFDPREASHAPAVAPENRAQRPPPVSPPGPSRTKVGRDYKKRPQAAQP